MRFLVDAQFTRRLALWFDLLRSYQSAARQQLFQEEHVVSHSNDENERDNECVVQSHPIPADIIDRYGVSNDSHARQDIATYVQFEARDETVLHVEMVRREIVLGEKYDIWDVT